MTDSKNKFCCVDKVNLYELCTNCYNAFFNDPSFTDAMREVWETWETEPRVSSSSSICECGSESAGGTTHSHWCPKGKNK
jgi:hypothetical protein